MGDYVAANAGQDVSSLTEQYSDAAIQAAAGIVDAFLAAIDWYKPALLQVPDLDKRILDAGLANDPNAALNNLYQYASATWPGTVAANPGARFGMNPDAYKATTTAMQQAYYEATGQGMPDAILTKAIQNGWSAQQLQSYLYDFAAGSGPLMGLSQLDTSSTPWLRSGVSYQTAQQAMSATNPVGPVTPASVASWWRFTSTARQTQSSHLAGQTAQQGKGLTIQPETR